MKTSIIQRKSERPESAALTGQRHGEFGAKQHLGFLDGIRGGAALWVLIAHCMLWGGWSGPSLPQPRIAVDIFMVVSGFLMVYQYRSRERLEPLDSLRTAQRFWMRRFFRIAPVYYLVLIFVIVFWSPHSQGLKVLQSASPERWANLPQYNPTYYNMDWRNVLMHATFLFGLVPRYAASTLTTDWSIGLEMQFYAVFPILYFAVRKVSWVITIIVGFLLSAACNHVFEHLQGPVPGLTGLFSEPAFLLMKLPMFLIGMLAGEVFDGTGRNTQQRALMTVCAFVLAARYSFYSTAVLGIMFWLAWYHESGTDASSHAISKWLNRLLSNPVSAFMAETSYCVYLTHCFFISLIGGYLFKQQMFLSLSSPLRNALLAAIVCVGSYSLAWVLHHLLEKPSIEFGRRTTNRWFPLRVASRV